MKPKEYKQNCNNLFHDFSAPYLATALSVYLFVVSAILCFFVYRMTNDNDPDGSKKAAKKRAKAERRKR